MYSTNNNPIGRLRNILIDISSSKTNSPYIELANIFDLDANDKGAILSSYSNLYKLCEDSKLLIKRLNNVNHEKLTSHVNKVILILPKLDFTNDIYGLSALKNSLNDELLSSLDLCSEFLSHTYNERSLEYSQLDEIGEKSHALRCSINDSDINTELKSILLKNLDTIDLSISKYKLDGISGIESALNSTIGNIVLKRDLVKTENEKSIIKNMFILMSSINTVISFSKNVPAVIGDIISLIK